jgi:hypothetical protein
MLSAGLTGGNGASGTAGIILLSATGYDVTSLFQ